MILYQILYAVFCIGFAYLNSYLIGKGKRIYHGLNGLLHIAVSVCGFLFFNWQTAISCLFVGRLFFDWFLILFRRLPLGYVPKSPKAIADKIEKKIFGMNGVLPKVIYAAIIIVVNLV